MKEFRDRVAVVTGAASGMGLAFAHRFAEAGMKLVLADIEPAPLARAEAALRAKGADVLALRTDVGIEAEVTALADASFARFGHVHVVCNNAGVSAVGSSRTPCWEIPLPDWHWVLGVNFMGVLYGIRAFVPRMIAGGGEGHIVNTASVFGLMTQATPYNVSKHGVVCLTEGLYKELRQMGAKLSASVLCPGLIDTAILQAERNRPAAFGPARALADMKPDARQAVESFGAQLKAGIAPDDVARQVFEAIRDDRFYIIPAQPWVHEAVRVRLHDILEQRNPTILPPAVG